MSSKKEQTLPPFESIPRKKQIEDVISTMQSLPPGEIAELATKLNIAAVMGDLTFTKAESASIKLLSQKFIPDAPKQINLNAKVQSEQVILGWLKTNDNNLQDAQGIAADNRKLEQDMLLSLTDFAESFGVEKK